MDSKKIIKYGVICNSDYLELWQYNVIQKLTAQDVKLKLIITNAKPENIHKPSSKLWQKLNFSSIKKSGQKKRIKIQDHYSQIKQTQLSILIEKDLQSDTLDFIFNFTTDQVNSIISNATKHGIWQLYNDYSNNNNTLLGFWEIYWQKNTTTVSIIKWIDDSKQVVLRENTLKTLYSFTANRDQILKEVPRWIMGLCVDIKHNGFDSIEEKKDNKTYDLPSNTQIILFCLRSYLNKYKRSFRLIFFIDFWNIGVVKQPITEFLKEGEKPPVEWYPNLSKKSFAADPFAILKDNELHILYEAFPFDNPSGKIDYVKYKDGEYSNECKVWDNSYHNSYPFMFEYNNEVYSLPESSADNKVELYKLIAFPDQWEKQKMILPGYAGVDNTLLYYNNTWWIFATDLLDGPHYNLKVFYADDLYGEWVAHPKNPVKTDIRSSRPAGTIFEKDNVFYRPSMDYSEKVEGRIVINQIVKLTKTDYKEVDAALIEPYTNTKYSDKIHTICKAGNYTVIDSCKETFIFSNIHLLKFTLKKYLRL